MITSRVAFSLSFFFISLVFMAMARNVVIPVNVGVLLDNDTWVGKMGLSCIKMALSDFYAYNDYFKTRLVLQTRDSTSGVVEAAAAALDLIKNVQVQAIIGPENSMQANFVIDLGAKAQVPIISFSVTSSSLTSSRRPYFFRIAQNDSSPLKAISAIVQAFAWREVVPIYIDNEYGEGIIPFLIGAMQDINTRVPYLSGIRESASDDEIGEELHKLMTMRTRVFIVHMSAELGSRLFSKAKEIGMMSKGYVWIMTDGITNLLNSVDPSVLESMEGVLGVKTYVPKTQKLEKFILDYQTIENADLNVFGLWAYDTAWALAIAVERIGTTIFGFDNSDTHTPNNSTCLETFGVSQTGPKLREALSITKFRGLSGEFNLVNGQLQSSTFEIINVNDNVARRVAFWTQQNGLNRKLNWTNTRTYSTPTANNLGTIIWPGDTTSVPKGWEITTNDKKLRIGVPKKDGFTEFVDLILDNKTHKLIKAKGYCIDIFKAVMKSLPYAVSYEFIPFVNDKGESAGTYNKLVHQVYLGHYDAVVGDVTIEADRSLHVDFTLPYTESSVSMVVPNKDSQNAWVFLKPLTTDLWLTIGSYFVFIGFVIWFLEHRINREFRGTPSEQISTSLWFSFSTMVFSHRGPVMCNTTRFVVIIWVFVVLILTQSYTASLSSLLTVQQLLPTATDIDQLIKNGEHVGYQKDSFVLKILQGLKFHKSKLKEYSSAQQCDELLSKGSANGGIAAAFDETPYMKLFLAQYSSKYTLVLTKYKTDGFGFVFPRGSPLVADVSRAVLHVTEGEEMNGIETNWLGEQNNCLNYSSTQDSSNNNNLNLASFGGLFLIAGIASLIAVIISVCMFFHKERKKIFMPLDSEGSKWRRIVHILKIFHGAEGVNCMDGEDNERKNFEVDSQFTPIAQPSQETVPTIELANTIKSEPRLIRSRSF